MAEPNTQQRIVGCYAEASAFFSAASRAFTLASVNKKSNPETAAEARGVAQYFIKKAEAAEERAVALAATA